MARFYQHKKPFSRTSWLFIGLIVVGAICATLAMIFVSLGSNGVLLLIGYFMMAAGSVGLMATIIYSLWRDEKEGSHSGSER